MCASACAQWAKTAEALPNNALYNQPFLFLLFYFFIPTIEKEILYYYGQHLFFTTFIRPAFLSMVILIQCMKTYTHAHTKMHVHTQQ